MKNITFFLVFIFSIMNAQVSEKITLPETKISKRTKQEQEFEKKQLKLF